MTQFETGGLQRNGRTVIGRIGAVCNTDWGSGIIGLQVDIGYITTYTPTRTIIVPLYKTNNYNYGGILQITYNGQVSIFVTQTQSAKNGFVSAEFVYFTDK